jgi:class 3 adenylate cyclase/tetratricopeptide (TPR) repeat protein
MAVCPACGRENPEEARFCSSCGAALTAVPPTRETRKTVTVVFCDVTGSTALGEQLDPESLRRVMARYFDEMQAVVERHEGTVEKFIGDAVMAVFGVPVLHEDDALRAVRAAAEMRERLEALNEDLERGWGVRIQVRTGVNTGEVVAGDASGGQRFATGDAVNVAKRFEEAAPGGEIFLGEPTYRLVRDAVEVEPVEALELKGKEQPTSAYKLLSIEPGAEGRARRLDSPMVGRKREQALLQQAYERAVGERACHLFTVLGAAGVGKSRLIEEFLNAVGGDTTVVRGRCLPYGEGITFWPLVEIMRALYGEDLAPMIAARLSGDENAELIAERVAAAVGRADSGSSSEETFWAVRRLFEAHARERPLVVVFDDVQWGEATFLDLIEHISDLSRDAPILLLCLARPELLDRRGGWAGGKFNATSVLLEPLNDEDSAELIANLLGRAELDAHVRTRVTEAAEGNPLFVEEMIGMLIDDGVLERQNGSWAVTGSLELVSVPPTIQALLSARLDRLGTAERAVVEGASVEGKVFHRGAVAELTPAQISGEVGSHLQALVRKELVRPDRAQFAGEDAFRFRHLLIRDAAYEAMPKELRAELHERFAAWLERVAAERVPEYEEIIGYHLEQAYRFRVELGPPDEEARSLGARAGERLGSAGERALSRSDATAAVSLLDRALETLPAESETRPKLLCDLGLALTDLGEFARAEAVLSDAMAAADAANDPVLGEIATLRSTWVLLLTGRGLIDEAKTKVEESARTLERLGHEDGLAEAFSLLGTLLMWTGRCAESTASLERSAALARQAGDDRVAARSLSWLVIAAFWGPIPVPEALALCDRVVQEGSSRYVEGYAGIVKGAFHSMAGRWDESRASTATGRKLLEELGQHMVVAAGRMALARAEFFGGRISESEDELRLGYDVLQQMGEKGYLSTTAALLALALCAQGRHDEAESYAEQARELGAVDDITTQLYWRCARAEVLAARGEIEEALRLVQEAQDLIDPTDYLTDRAAALLSRATVEKAAGNRDWARAAIEQAIGLFQAKGDVTGAAHSRTLIAEL